MRHLVPAPFATVADVKQCLLPLPPLQAVLEWLVECLPRKRVPVVLKPLLELEIKNEAEGDYLSTGSSPTFQFITNGQLASGWYYLETALTRSSGSRYAQINCNLIQHSAHDPLIQVLIPVASNLRGSVREVIYIPNGVSTIDWVPSKARGFLSQSPILLHKISGLESRLRRWHRVLFDLWRFRLVSLEGRPDFTFQVARRDLQTAYSASTFLRLKRLSGFEYSSYLAERERQEKQILPMLLKQAKESCSFTISIVMDVANNDHFQLQACFESLRLQSYLNWELLLVGDCPDELINQFHGLVPCREIKRIQHGNKTFAEQLNTAIDLATGKYVLRMQPSYTLSPNALLYLTAEFKRYPKANLIYFDTDLINTRTGERLCPCFRPDWNPEFLNSHQYMGECIAYSKEHLVKVGGYRQGYDGAEDYDLILRVTQRCTAGEIKNIRNVIFHKQSESGSENPVSSKIHVAGKLALQDSLSSIDAVVSDGAFAGLYRVRYPLPKEPPLVSIIVPTRDRVDLLKMCVSSVQNKTKYPNWEMIIVDNGSAETETLDYLKTVQKQDKRIKVSQYSGAFNYSAINNRAVKECSGEVLVLLNNDVEVIDSDWLNELVSHAIRPGVGAVGAKLLYSDNTVQHAGVIIGMGGVAGHVHRFINDDDAGYFNRAIVTQNLSAVTGACLAIKKDRFLSVTGLDENLAVAFNDVDLCMRLLDAGMRNVFTPWARLYHHESQSRGINDTPEKEAFFQKEFTYMKSRWKNKLDSDPAWNSYGWMVKHG